MNPFEAKFRSFSEKLTKKNADGKADHIAAKSGEVFKDKPFTDEFHTVYQIAQWGQSIAQVVTFLTTAALGVFALTHIIPLWWGIYIAVPLGLLFAFGVEKVKRSTLAIASKHLLKYKTFGFVGFVALLTLCVSIGAALYGAKELPGVVYAKPARAIDPAAVAALTSDINRVQSDIDRLQSTLKSESNWVAENRTLPKLQKERAALVARRDAATTEAQGRGDAEHAEALADRAAKVDKMQTYSVGAAIVAELVFLLCTGFVLYFLFRAFSEMEHEAAEVAAAVADATSKPAGATIVQQPATNGHHVGTANGIPINNEVRRPIGFAYGNRRETFTQNVHSNERLCQHCQQSYVYGHARQRYCSEVCRVASWETRTGRTLQKQRPSTG